jgi:hypothetical protein
MQVFVALFFFGLLVAYAGTCPNCYPGSNTGTSNNTVCQWTAMLDMCQGPDDSDFECLPQGYDTQVSGTTWIITGPGAPYDTGTPCALSITECYTTEQACGEEA